MSKEFYEPFTIEQLEKQLRDSSCYLADYLNELTDVIIELKELINEIERRKESQN